VTKIDTNHAWMPAKGVAGHLFWGPVRKSPHFVALSCSRRGNKVGQQLHISV